MFPLAPEGNTSASDRSLVIPDRNLKIRGLNLFKLHFHPSDRDGFVETMNRTEKHAEGNTFTSEVFPLTPNRFPFTANRYPLAPKGYTLAATRYTFN